MVATVEGPAHQVTNYYEPNRNVLLTKSNTRNSDNTIISSVTYEVNSIGQRKNRTTTDATLSSVITDWNYDPLGQVTSENNPGTDTDRAFEYDTIGNRKKSADSLILPPDDNYTSNALNQYTQISVSSASSVVPSYDDDSNAKSYPLPANPSTNSALTWDAENRMTTATVNGTTVTYTYDAYSRRIAQTTGSTTTLYLYDAWNCIAEYKLHNSSFILHTSLLWGLGLSGSMQGAGGVGGLLQITDHSTLFTHHFPLYDGNGNINEYLDTNATVVAHYEYDAFGNTTIATGTKANDFSYRFSTKPRDTLTGLYYYGYRFYDPFMGRWLNRDPIQEKGGLNLYGFLYNHAIKHVDVLGYSELDWEQYAKTIVDLVNIYEVTDFNIVFKTLIQQYFDNDTDADDCQDDFYEIWEAIKETNWSNKGSQRGHEDVVGDGTVFGHGKAFRRTFNDNGSVIIHFALATSWDGLGNVVQDIGEEFFSKSESDDFQDKDTARDYAASYLVTEVSDIFDTWSECKCRCIAELFRSEKIKFTDLFGMGVDAHTANEIMQNLDTQKKQDQWLKDRVYGFKQKIKAECD